MISKISLATNVQPNFGHFWGKSRQNIENALTEHYKRSIDNDKISRKDEKNLNTLENSILEVNACKIDNSNDLYVSIYDPVTQANYFNGNVEISGQLAEKLCKICKLAEKNRYTLTR